MYMANKKVRLTESELQQVVEASVRQILLKEGFFKKSVDAPANLTKERGLNESVYGNDGFVSTSTMDVNRQPQRNLKNKIDMARDLWWMIEDKGEHDEDGHHIFLSPGIVYNGDELDVIHTVGGPNYPLWVFGTAPNIKHYDFDKLPYNIQQQIFKDVEAYEPEEYEEEYDDDDLI